MSKLFLTLCILFSVALAAKTLRWNKETDASQVRPSERSAGILGGVDKTLVLFGGFFECFDVSTPGCEHTYFGDTWEFDTQTGLWTETTPALSPEARAFMATDNWEEDDSVVIFGGIRYNAAVTVRQFYGDIWAYSPDTNTWRLVPQNNVGPGPRMGAGIAIDGNTMYVFGGIDPTFQSHNDLWSFDLTTGLWTLITPDNTNPALPDDRYIFTFEINRPRSDTIFLHGGNFSPAGSGEQRQDSWEYNIQTNTWTEITGDFPGRIHNGAGARNKEFYLVFGDVNDDANECRTNQASGGQNPVDEVWRYAANKDTWEQLTVTGGPGDLKRVASTVLGNKLYVWGGYDFVCGEDNLGGFAVYQRDLYSLKL